MATFIMGSRLVLPWRQLFLSVTVFHVGAPSFLHMVGKILIFLKRLLSPVENQ